MSCSSILQSKTSSAARAMLLIVPFYFIWQVIATFWNCWFMICNQINWDQRKFQAEAVGFRKQWAMPNWKTIFPLFYTFFNFLHFTFEPFYLAYFYVLVPIPFSFLRLQIETIHFLQMHFNLNFNDLSSILDILRFPHRHEYYVYHLYFYSRVSSADTVSPQKRLLEEGPSPIGGATGVLPARFFCQLGWPCRLSVTSVSFYHSYLAI